MLGLISNKLYVNLEGRGVYKVTTVSTLVAALCHYILSADI